MYKNLFSILLLIIIVLTSNFVGYHIAQAVKAEGSALIDGAGNVTVQRAVSHKFSVVLTIGDSGITADADNPTFTIPSDFTAPSIKEASAVAVDADGEWFVEGGGTCPVAISSSSASGQVITADVIDVPTACVVGATGVITLTYQGTSSVIMGATALAIMTADSLGNSPVALLNGNPGVSPTITVVDTANITIQSALIYSSNTIRVTFDDPGGGITGVDYTKWHIDANAVYGVDGGGLTPLNPTSTTIISAGTPWMIELTFSGTPFIYPTTYYDAINGLYVDAGGVTAGGNTNAVVLHPASILITSKYLTVQSATIISSNKVKVELNYSQPALDTVDVLKWHIDVNGGGVTPLEPTSAVITFFGGPRTIELTFPDNSFSDTSKFYSTATGLYIDAGGVTTILDDSDPGGDMTVHSNAVVSDSSSIAITDGQKPILVSFTSTTPDGTYGPGSNINITATYSENIASGSVTVDLNNHPTTLITLSTISTNKLSGNYVVGATGSGQDITGLDVLTITANSATDTVPLVNTDTTIPTINITTASNINVDTTVPSTPIASPIADTYASVQGVTLSSVGSTSIRYTIDGTDPSTCSSGLLYSGAIAVSSSLTIKARGCDDVDNISLLGTFVYAINISNGSGRGGGRILVPTSATLIKISGCNNRINGFSTITGQSCATNIPHNEQISSVGLFHFTLLLKMGSKGNEVTELQKFLNGNPYNNGLVVDRNFGLKTKMAVIKFQLANGLKGDGIVGPLTRVVLNK